MHIRHHVKYPLLFFSGFKERPFFYRQIFEKHSDVKFHENLSSGSRVFPCAQTERDKTKPRVTFRNFTNVPNKTKKTATNRNVYVSPGFDRKNFWKSRGTNLKFSPVTNFLYILRSNKIKIIKRPNSC
jgi:hypothetical protein